MTVSIGSENDPVSVSLPPFSSDKRKTCRRQGENTVNKNQAATTSADKLKPLTIIMNDNQTDSTSADETKPLTFKLPTQTKMPPPLAQPP